MVIQVLARQLFASLTVTQCWPAAKPVAVAVTWVFVHTKVYGEVPPVPTAVAEPVAVPVQPTFTTDRASTVAVTAVGWVRVTQAVAIQPLPSVVVTQ